MGSGSGRDGGEAGGGSGISARLPHPQQRCAVMPVFFFSQPSMTPKDTQEMNFKATPWDAHPGPDRGWGVGSCPSPLPACSSRTGGLEGLSWSGRSQGVQGGTFRTCWDRLGRPQFIEWMLEVRARPGRQLKAPLRAPGWPSLHPMFLGCSVPLPDPGSRLCSFSASVGSWPLMTSCLSLVLG